MDKFAELEMLEREAKALKRTHGWKDTPVKVEVTHYVWDKTGRYPIGRYTRMKEVIMPQFVPLYDDETIEFMENELRLKKLRIDQIRAELDLIYPRPHFKSYYSSVKNDPELRPSRKVKFFDISWGDCRITNHCDHSRTLRAKCRRKGMKAARKIKAELQDYQQQVCQGFFDESETYYEWLETQYEKARQQG